MSGAVARQTPTSGTARSDSATPSGSAPVRISNPGMAAEGTAVYGLVRVRSQYSVPETARRLGALIREQGLQIFGDVDFAGDAGRAGVAMRPMRQLVFGNPRSGTQLVIAAPTLALDLPVRVLVYQDGAGEVWLAYNDPAYLRNRHQLDGGLFVHLASLPTLVARAVGIDPL